MLMQNADVYVKAGVEADANFDVVSDADGDC